MESNLLKQGERLDDLQLGGLGLIQDPDKFCFGVDAVLLSERLVQDDVYTSIHMEEYEVEARDTKLGPEEITRERQRESILPDWRFRQIRLRWHREVSVIITWRTEWRL